MCVSEVTRVRRQQRYAPMACRELASKAKDIGERGKVSGSGLNMAACFPCSSVCLVSAFEAARLMKRSVRVGRGQKQTCAAGRHGYFSWGGRGEASGGGYHCGRKKGTVRESHDTCNNLGH